MAFFGLKLGLDLEMRAAHPPPPPPPPPPDPICWNFRNYRKYVGFSLSTERRRSYDTIQFPVCHTPKEQQHLFFLAKLRAAQINCQLDSAQCALFLGTTRYTENYLGEIRALFDVPLQIRHQVLPVHFLKSKTEKPPKLLSPLGMRRVKFILFTI